VLRHGGHLSVAMFDLDRFKNINDSRGHAAGDRVLREFGRILASEIRGEDVAGRMGGEEFALVISGAEGARSLCERIRERLASTRVECPPGEAFSVTVSVGLAWLEDGPASLDALLSRADEALYRAKAEGRNRVVAWK
jgi:two-component system, cell cycle response regulator